MHTLTKLRLASLCLLTLLAACGGGGSGGGGSTGSSQLAPSMRTPQPGQLTGNWTLSTIQVVEALGLPANVRTGMNLRLSDVFVEVFLDEYVGPNSILPKLMLEWFGGGLDMTNVVTPAAFTLTLRSDFGPAFGYAKDVWYTTVVATGQLVGDTVQVRLTREEFIPDQQSQSVRIGRSVLDLGFVAGKNVVPPTGDWKATQVTLLTKSAFPLTAAQLAPLPTDVTAGQELRLGQTEIAEIFTKPFPVAALERSYPELTVRNHYSFLDNGVVQGFSAWEGKPSTSFAGIVGILDLNLFHTGDKLQGDLIVIGIKDQTDSGVYHVYLELQPVGAPAPVQLASDGRPAPWLFPSFAEFEARVAELTR